MNSGIPELLKYAQKNLIEHLGAAGRFADIHLVLAKENKNKQNAWRSIKEASGDMQGYFDDVARAWACADECRGSYTLVNKMALQVYYGAIITSMNSVSANLPAEILVAMVNKDLLPPNQAFGYAQRIPNETNKIKALTKLSSFLSVLERQEVLDFALTQALSIAIESGLESLFELLPFLDDNSRRQAISKTLTITHNKFDDFDEFGYPYALNLLPFIPFLAEPARSTLLRAILAVVRRAEYTFVVAEGLSRIAQYSSDLEYESLMYEAHPMALRTAPGLWRDYAFRCISIQLAAKGKGRDALQTLKTINDDWCRAGTLAATAQYLTSEEIGEAWHIAQNLSDEGLYNSPRAKALCGIAPYYPEQTRYQALQEAYNAVIAVADKNKRTELFLMILPHLSETLHKETLEETFNTIISTSYDWPQVEKLDQLAPLLSEVHLSQILTNIWSIGESAQIYSTIRNLILQIPRTRQSQVAITVIHNVRNVGRAILMPTVTEVLMDCLLRSQRAKILSEAFLRAMASPNDELKIVRLIELAPRLSKSNQLLALGRALDVIETVEDLSIKSIRISDIASYLPARLLYRAIEIARQLPLRHPLGGRQSPRDQALKDLAVRLGELGKLPDVLELTLEISEEDLFGWGTNARSFVLSRVAKFLPLPMLNQALEVADKLTKQYWRGEALAAIAIRFNSVGQRTEALSVIEMIQHEYWRAYTLAMLLVDKDALERQVAVDDLLSTARTLGRGTWQVSLILELLPYISDLALPEALDYAFERTQEISYTPSKIEYLRRLAPYLTRLPKHTMIGLWSRAIHTWATSSRSQFLACLSEMAPVIYELIGIKGIKELINRLQKVDYWWP